MSYKNHYWIPDVDFNECERCGLKMKKKRTVTANLRKGPEIISIFKDSKWEIVMNLPECTGNKRVKYITK